MYIVLSIIARVIITIIAGEIKHNYFKVLHYTDEISGP